MATLTVYPNPLTSVDGYVRRSGSNITFSDIRDGAGTGSNYTDSDANIARLQANTSTDRYQVMQRAIILFDTSPLTAAATISAGVLSLFGQDAVANLGTAGFECDIVASTPASDTVLADSDYAQLGLTVFSSIAYASFQVEAYNDFTLDANGITNITKEGISKFGGRGDWDLNNSFGGSWGSGLNSNFLVYTADQTGTDNDPKLVVTYTIVVGPANLKTYNTNLAANIKSINTNLLANIKSLNTNV